jgi:hypothetical protein
VVFFGKPHMFLELSRISLFGAKRAYPQHETPKLQEVFLSKTPLNSHREIMWRCSCFKHRGFSLEGYMYFFNSAE